MSYGFGSFGRDYGFGVSRAGAAGGPSIDPAWTPPVLSLNTGVTTYPPDFNASLDMTWVAGDYIRIQLATTEVSLLGTPDIQNVLRQITNAEVLAGVINMSLSGITSPAKTFIRTRGENGSRLTAYSNIVEHGDATAATITSSATWNISAYSAAPQYPLTSSLPGYWSITGGVDAAKFSVDAATGLLTLIETPAYNTQASYDVQVTITTYGGVATAQSITVNNAIDFTPTQFTFTDVTGATTSTQYTSDVQTIAGLTSGAPIPLSVTGGTVSKNGGAYVAGPVTMQNGDTFTVRVDSSASPGTAVNVTATAGTVSDTYRVTTAGGAVYTPSSSGEKIVTGLGYGSSTYTFTAVQFIAGNPVVWVFAGGASRVTTGVKVNGVSCTKRWEAPNTEMSIWTCGTAVSTGTYDVEITANFGLNDVYCSCGSITGAASDAPTDTDGLNFAYQGSNPVAASGSMTKPAGGASIYFAFLGGGTTPITLNDGGTVIDNSATIKQVELATTTTPSFNLASAGYAGIAAISWSP